MTSIQNPESFFYETRETSNESVTVPEDETACVPAGNHIGDQEDLVRRHRDLERAVGRVGSRPEPHHDAPEGHLGAWLTWHPGPVHPKTRLR